MQKEIIATMGRKMALTLETFTTGTRAVQVEYSDYQTSQKFSVTLWNGHECMWIQEYENILAAVRKYEKLIKTLKANAVPDEEKE